MPRASGEPRLRYMVGAAAVCALAAGWVSAEPTWAASTQDVSRRAPPIIFDANRTGSPQLYAIEPDGTELLTITLESEGAFGKSDGSRIASWLKSLIPTLLGVNRLRPATQPSLAK